MHRLKILAKPSEAIATVILAAIYGGIGCGLVYVSVITLLREFSLFNLAIFVVGVPSYIAVVYPFFRLLLGSPMYIDYDDETIIAYHLFGRTVTVSKTADVFYAFQSWTNFGRVIIFSNTPFRASPIKTFLNGESGSAHVEINRDNQIIMSAELFSKVCPISQCTPASTICLHAK